MINAGINELIDEVLNSVDKFGLIVALVVTFILMMIIGERENARNFKPKRKAKK
ncbi:hypothetical protein D3C81_772520 [compost metagenome]